MLDRRSFLTTMAAAVSAPVLPLQAAGNAFRFAVIADAHIIDEFYRGPEGSPEDAETILKTSASLQSTRARIEAIRPKVELVFLAGDYFHNYPSEDIDYYFQHKTRIDIAKELTDGFSMPVHVGFGNHDYGVPAVSREMSHELFRRKLGLKPYYSIEYKGFKFVHLNNFLGASWDRASSKFNKGKGSLGEEQLNWFEAELNQHKPTFVFLHFPLLLMETDERPGYGLLSILKKNPATVQRVFAGHWHKWFEFGRSYGVPHLVVASTRFDSNAYMIVEADSRKAEHRLLNIDSVDWNTHHSSAWPPDRKRAGRLGG
jgi:hypothetical protein